MPAFSLLHSFRPGSKLVATIVGFAALGLASISRASCDRWDYVPMVDHDTATGQEVGYLMLHVDLPITVAGAAIASAAAPQVASSVAAKPVSTSVVARAATAVQTVASPAAQSRAEQAVLSSLSGEGDFDLSPALLEVHF